MKIPALLIKFSIFHLAFSIFLFELVPFRARPAFAASDNLYFLHTDHLGSTRAVTDRDGNVVVRYDYYPYGSLREVGPQGGPTSVERLYTSQIRDGDTSLYFYNARYYNPTLATFISPDSLQGPNRYAYVSNNPINMTDPSGNQGGGGGGGDNWLDQLSYTPSGYGDQIGVTTPVGETTVAHTPWDPYYQGEPDPAGFYKTVGGAAAVSIAAPLTAAYGPAAVSYANYKALEAYASYEAGKYVLKEGLKEKGIAAIRKALGRWVQHMSRLDKAKMIPRDPGEAPRSWWDLASSSVGSWKPLEDVQYLSDQSVRRLGSDAGARTIRALFPHNAYEAAVSGNATCVDAARVSAELLSARGIPANVADVSTTWMPHYATQLVGTSKAIMYGGQIRPLGVIERAQRMFGGR